MLQIVMHQIQLVNRNEVRQMFVGPQNDRDEAYNAKGISSTN